VHLVGLTEAVNTWGTVAAGGQSAQGAGDEALLRRSYKEGTAAIWVIPLDTQEVKE
jgi:hypothetical protein